MDANQSSSNRNLWIALGALLVGLIIGLVLLGWWLFPIQWTDAAPVDLLPDYQVDYLLAAVDSFALTFDSNAALQRYQSLGEDGPSTLATVQADPSANPTAVAAYSAVVTAGQEQGYIEEPVQQGLSNVGKFLIALLLIALVAALLVWLLFRGRGQEPAGETPPVEPGPPPAAAETPPVVVEEALAEETLAEEVPAEGDTHPVQVSSGDTQPVTTTQAEAPPPLWLPEEEPEQGGSGMGAGSLAAVGLVGAAIAATGDEEVEQTAAEAGAEEAGAEEAGAEEGAGEDTVQTLLDSAGSQAIAGTALGAAALAASGLDETGQPTEPVTIEELAGIEPDLPAEAAVVAGFEVLGEEPAATEQPVDVEAEPGTELPNEAAVYEAAQMEYGLAYIEGIGPVYAEKLAAIGITTPGELLEQGATPRGRQALAEQSGISGRLILEWVNHVDLFRIKGVGSEYADLLEAAGVDTVVELAMRNPDNLYQTMQSVNESKRLVRKPPVLSQVQDWVAQAKTLPRKIYY
jgi:predicted flap endonuclease-1-like 5' DNA nuclease